MSITPNMNLDLPTPTVTPGPTYASQNNTAFSTVDLHDHTSGKGVQVPVDGLNFNSDLLINDYNISEIHSTRMTDNASALSGPTDINCAYTAGGNLYYNDVNGNQIQITAGGALNAASIGGIGGDYATSGASEFYTASSETFSFTSTTNVPANLDAASVAVREAVASSYAITLKSPTSLASAYDVTLPTALPASTLPITMNTSGNLATGQITTAQITDLAITTGKIADNSVTTYKMASLVRSYSAPITSVTTIFGVGFIVVTGLAFSVSSTGRPFSVGLFPQGGGTGSSLQSSPSTIAVYCFRNGLSLGASYLSNAVPLPPNSFSWFDETPPIGTNTYQVYISGNVSSVLQATQVQLIGYEL